LVDACNYVDGGLLATQDHAFGKEEVIDCAALTQELRVGDDRKGGSLAKSLGAPAGMSWTDATVVKDVDGRPHLRVTGTVAARADALGVDSLHLSLSHDAGIASAVVIAEG